MTPLPQTADCGNWPDAGLRKRLMRGLVALHLAALITALGIGLQRIELPIVDTFDKHIGDLPVALGSPRATDQRLDIALVLITEDTLLDYETRSPIDRNLVAELIRTVDLADPRAIGIDLIFDRRTRHDASLLQAIRETKSPLVLGAIDRRADRVPCESLAVQEEFLRSTDKPFGHLMFARKQSQLLAYDSVVRYIAPPLAPTASGTGAMAVAACAAPGPVAGPVVPAFVED